jgi:SEC-C motif
MKIKKSAGQNRTEKLLSKLCDETFLKLWSYPNPVKSDGKELCDLIAIFENHIFIFFDRESRKFDEKVDDFRVQWKRWEKEVIQKQITTMRGAERYIKEHSGEIFLDANQTPIPISIPLENLSIHRIIVAHGAAEACKNYSKDNISGSLAISYEDSPQDNNTPFMVSLDRENPIHIFDSHNLEIILKELDTIYDFRSYIVEKEAAIKKYQFLVYCGEEDLLAHYFYNFDAVNERHCIGTAEKEVNSISIGEGEWESFIKKSPYKNRKKANESSYLWDELLQRTCDNALNGTLMGNSDISNGQSAIFEMAKEPRFSRRNLSEMMITSIQNIPSNMECFRNLSFMNSFYKDVGYVFLQLSFPNVVDYTEYRTFRQGMLLIACGVAKNKFPHLKKIIGIAVDAPKYSELNSEDFLLMNCGEWTEEQRLHYKEANKEFVFFESENKTVTGGVVSDFPPSKNPARKKLGRNDPCVCRSGKKYKKCCLSSMEVFMS